MELKGKIIAVMEKRSGVSMKNGKEWASQDFVMEIPGQYPKHCQFNVFGADKLKEYDIKMGDEVTIKFDIDARVYNGRWYNEIKAWHAENHSIQQRVSAATPTAAPEAIPAPVVAPPEPEDDLPF
jgi:hypothetical protein